MKKYVKEFIKRGLMTSGIGCLIVGIVDYIIFLCTKNTYSGDQVILGIISGFVLGFIQGGVSLIPEIEELSLVKKILFQFLALYISYTSIYLLNRWIPIDLIVLLIYTISFIVLFIIIWFIVYFISKRNVNKINQKLNH